MEEEVKGKIQGSEEQMKGKVAIVVRNLMESEMKINRNTQKTCRGKNKEKNRGYIKKGKMCAKYIGVMSEEEGGNRFNFWKEKCPHKKKVSN